METIMNARHSKTERTFLLFFLLGTFVVVFFIFKPFLYAIILAIIFATVFDQVHNMALHITRNKRALAALLSTLSVLIVVVVPLTFMGIQISKESTQLYSSLIERGGMSSLSHDIDSTIQRFFTLSPVPIKFSVDTGQYVTQGLDWLLKNLGALFTSIAKILMSIFIFLLALYYLFKDGHVLKRVIIELSPLQDIYDETILGKLAVAVNSVVRGSLIVAIVQGILTAIGLTIFGVPNPALWGVAAAIAAVIPGIGTALVIIPAILYLYVSGALFSAVGLLIWGTFAVGLVDNFLGPKLVERGMRLHSFLVLISILGGLSLFGPIGFLLGPLVVSMLFALIDIYSHVNKREYN